MDEISKADPAMFSPDEKLIGRYSDMVRNVTNIKPELYTQYNVKRGLRNADGSGVLVGLTSVGSVIGYGMFEQEIQPVPGLLLYRGIDVRDLVKGCQADNRLGYEETVFLLLFGRLPSQSEHEEFFHLLNELRPLPKNFKEEAIIHLASPDVMNKLARCVLASYSFDADPDNVSIEKVVKQSLRLIAQLPTYAVYGYQAKAHYYMGQSLHMRNTGPGLSTAEHILCLLRPYSQYTRLEAEILDLCLVLHAEHGGGNNSTFTTHVVSSTFTDTYSAIAAAILSLKGPRHGGANLQVCHMMADIKANVKKWDDRNEVTDYLRKILNKEAFDRSGLIYGLGHAVYKVSDPRAEILKDKAAQLVAENKEFEAEFNLYNLVAEIGVQLFLERSKTGFGLCVNVDFYSGFVYKMLGIPVDLFTPLFAIGRMPGWAAHRLEELNTGSRIIRPAYKCIQPAVSYVPIAQRG
ncbi:MAG: citrate synthase [Kiritimatiellae bacterium]|jgi:citrate synthase|nr:citrate synthase [Kiritimatiellia bacterium]